MLKTSFLLLGLATVVEGLSWVYNPGCTDPTVCGDANMLLTRTSYSQSLWSTDRTLAGVLISGTNTLTVNWTRYNHGGEESGAAISVDTRSSIGLNLLSVQLGNEEESEVLSLGSADWTALSHSGDNVSTTFTYSCPFMTVKILVNEGEGRMDAMPHLKYSTNVTLVDIALNISRIPGRTVENATQASLYLEMAGEAGTLLYDTNKKSFDDEVAPALFKYAIFSDNSTASVPDTAYSLWRPVVYTDTDRSVLASLVLTDTISGDKTATSLLSNHYPSNKIVKQRFKISPPDGKKIVSDQLLWSIAVGRGEPATETISLLGLILTLVIVGLPCLALVAGVLAVMCKRRRAPNPGLGYAPI